MDEKKLAERLTKGDTDALGKIIETYSGYVHTVAFNFSRGSLTPEDIDDIAADVFYRLWKCRENINANIGLRSYLSAAARNAVKNRFKQAPPELSDISELELASDFSAENAAELNEMMSCLYEGLRELPKKDRECFVRFYIYGESSVRIAEAFGMSAGAVVTKLYRIRKKLRDHLLERGFDHV